MTLESFIKTNRCRQQRDECGDLNVTGSAEPGEDTMLTASDARRRNAFRFPSKREAEEAATRARASSTGYVFTVEEA